MKPNLPIICSLIILICTACNNEEEEINLIEVVEVADYSSLQVGNYWIYDWYEVRPDGSEQFFQKRDTLRIEADTLIEGRTYYIRSGTFLGQAQGNVVLYDSADFLLSYPDARVLFTINPNEEFIRNFGLPDQPISVGTYRLNESPETVEVPAGVFECLNFQGRIESLQLNYPHGTRFNSNFYAKEVGLVKVITQFHSDPNDLEMRLVAFGRE